MEKKMETTVHLGWRDQEFKGRCCWGYIGIMETRLETNI